MTTKRYVYNVHKNCIETDTGEFVAYLDSVNGIRIARKWNELADENEQLKHRLKHYEMWFKQEEIREIEVGDWKMKFTSDETK